MLRIYGIDHVGLIIDHGRTFTAAPKEVLLYSLIESLGSARIAKLALYQSI